MQPRRPRL